MQDHQFVIRNLSSTDYKALKPLIDELGYPSSEEEVKERLDNIILDKNFKTLVADIEGRIVGFIGLSKSYAYEINGCCIRITALIVTKEYRNKGIGGTRLIKSAEEWARENNASSIGLSSGLKRLGAHKFYESKGYHIKGYSFYKEI